MFPRLNDILSILLPGGVKIKNGTVSHASDPAITGDSVLITKGVSNREIHEDDSTCRMYEVKVNEECDQPILLWGLRLDEEELMIRMERFRLRCQAWIDEVNQRRKARSTETIDSP